MIDYARVFDLAEYVGLGGKNASRPCSPDARIF